MTNEARTLSGTSRTALFTVVMFLSGLASLIYQIVWQRVLSQEVGIDASSMAITVVIFLLSLSFGSLLGGLIVKKFSRLSATVYVVVEVAIGLFGLFSVNLLRFLNRTFAGIGFSADWFDLLLNFVGIGLPILLMGSTVPLLAHCFVKKGSEGRHLGILYGSNILGAAAGSLLSGFFLIEQLGLKGASYFAAAINIGIGVGFFMLFKEKTQVVAKPAARRKWKNVDWKLGFAAVLFGYVSLSFQVILFRVVGNVLGGKVFVFPLALAIYLLMMAVANLISGYFSDRVPRKYFSVLIALYFFATLATVWTSFHLYSDGLEQRTLFQWWKMALVFVPFWLLPILPITSFFPLLAKEVCREGEDAGSSFGVLLFLSTVGNGVGTWITAFFLLDRYGTLPSVVIALIALWGGVALLFFRNERYARACTAVCAAAVAGFAFVVPYDYYYKLANVAEVAEEKLGVVRYHFGYPIATIMVNGTSAANVIKDRELLANPTPHNFSSLMAVAPEFRPKRVLLIGLGSGVHAWGLKDYASIQQIDVIELSRGVVDLVEKYSLPQVQAIFDHPKINMIENDGRRFLQKAVKQNIKYDFIQLGTFYPDSPGSANLYSEDFIREIKGALTPTGYFSTLDCVGSTASALQVFSEGFLLDSIPLYAFFPKENRAIAESQKVPAWLVSHFGAELPKTLTYRTITRGRLNDVPRNTDDQPSFEYRLKSVIDPNYRNLRERLYQRSDLLEAPQQVAITVEGTEERL